MFLYSLISIAIAISIFFLIFLIIIAKSSSSDDTDGEERRTSTSGSESEGEKEREADDITKFIHEQTLGVISECFESRSAVSASQAELDSLLMPPPGGPLLGMFPPHPVRLDLGQPVSAVSHHHLDVYL